jgi:hypothetical protein
MKIESMRNVKTKAIIVIIGATETTSKSLRKYLSSVPGQPEVKGLQNTAIFSIARAHTHTHTCFGSANVQVQNIK